MTETRPVPVPEQIYLRIHGLTAALLEALNGIQSAPDKVGSLRVGPVRFEGQKVLDAPFEYVWNVSAEEDPEITIDLSGVSSSSAHALSYQLIKLVSEYERPDPNFRVSSMRVNLRPGPEKLEPPYAYAWNYRSPGSGKGKEFRFVVNDKLTKPVEVDDATLPTVRSTEPQATVRVEQPAVKAQPDVNAGPAASTPDQQLRRRWRKRIGTAALLAPPSIAAADALLANGIPYALQLVLVVLACLLATQGFIELASRIADKLPPSMRAWVYAAALLGDIMAIPAMPTILHCITIGVVDSAVHEHCHGYAHCPSSPEHNTYFESNTTYNIEPKFDWPPPGRRRR